MARLAVSGPLHVSLCRGGMGGHACMYVFVWKCASPHRDTHPCVCAGQRSALSVFLYLLPIVSEAGSLRLATQ